MKGKRMGKVKDKMSSAYRVAHAMIKDRLTDVDKKMAEEFEEHGGSDVIVIKGGYDHIEQVFNGIELKYNLVNETDIDTMNLTPDNILFINCPGTVTKKGLRKIVSFVESGGFLFTTDWALKHVIEPGFPGYLRYNNRSTADEVVRVEILADEDPFLQSLIGPNDDPQWWLEGSSYPIQIVNEKAVEVLIRSKEIKKKYGESPVFVTFDHGEGKVYHMISHFYLQRSETRSARQTSKGSDYLYDNLEMDSSKEAKYSSMFDEDTNLGEMEAAYSSSALMKKVLWDKWRKKNIKGK